MTASPFVPVTSLCYCVQTVRAVRRCLGAMAKVEADMEQLHSGGHHIIGIVDEGSIESGDDQMSMEDRAFLEGEDDSSYNFQDLSSTGVTYRFVQVGNDPLSHPSESVSPTPGQYYVIGHDNMCQPPKSSIFLSDRERNGGGASKTIKKRDDKRRATHNEVERRRRDKINSWIARLAALVPATAGQPTDAQSKGGILAKACDHIAALTSEQARYEKCIRENERLNVEVMKLKKELSEAWKENTVLKYQLSENSITPRTNTNGNS